MEVSFYKHDSYVEIRRKFTGAWANLRLELHRQTIRFYKEGYDEVELDTQFYPPETANELLFTLTDETTKAAARKLFADFYSHRGKPEDRVEAAIAGNFVDVIYHPSEADTLDKCNNPFILPLNKYVYSEFKQRFSERWTHLSIEIFQKKTTNDCDLHELHDDFDMKTLTTVNRLVGRDYYERDGFRDVIEKNVNETVLRDEIYLSDLANNLVRSGIGFRINNNRLGIYWNKDLIPGRLRDFQEATSV